MSVKSSESCSKWQESRQRWRILVLLIFKAAAGSVNEHLRDCRLLPPGAWSPLKQSPGQVNPRRPREQVQAVEASKLNWDGLWVSPVRWLNERFHELSSLRLCLICGAADCFPGWKSAFVRQINWTLPVFSFLLSVLSTFLLQKTAALSSSVKLKPSAWTPASLQTCTRVTCVGCEDEEKESVFADDFLRGLFTGCCFLRKICCGFNSAAQVFPVTLCNRNEARSPNWVTRCFKVNPALHLDWYRISQSTKNLVKHARV